ncbi:hypothetical protein [Ruminococcus sp.]|uniref:hypothetical protein n=1 Tax=Ruminococcus sp. TaxID=41978 RepID=UPI0025DFD958|nr:hypothetical protein [Ruminococcus sp.]MBQ8967205.1 hypothetical protein [Ruminococcus sp.]
MKKLYSLLAAAVMAFSLPLTAQAATHYDPNIAHITYSNAPEGTAYMDILVKMKTDDQNYVEFNQAPVSPEGETLDITAESEIAEYNEDGYVSLSVHHKKTESFVLGSGEDLMTMHSTKQVSSDFIDLSIAYGDFKAAYVDENGNILGVTKASVTEYSTATPYGFKADGDSLIYQRHGAHPRVIAMIFAAFVILFVSLPMIAFAAYRRHTKKIKAGDLAAKAKKATK